MNTKHIKKAAKSTAENAVRRVGTIAIMISLFFAGCLAAGLVLRFGYGVTVKDAEAKAIPAQAVQVAEVPQVVKTDAPQAEPEASPAAQAAEELKASDADGILEVVDHGDTYDLVARNTYVAGTNPDGSDWILESVDTITIDKKSGEVIGVAGIA